MMNKASSAHERRQLASSIEKLFHYLLVHVKFDTDVKVYDGDDVVFEHTFVAPREISLSLTLYTRIDSCHGAGNCCRVPFDLVYTDYDRQRILDYDHHKAVEEFGAGSADGFAGFRDRLIESLVPMRVIMKCGPTHIAAMIWVQRNREIMTLSGATSCPYLITGDDRYFCGIHPFKPLHCWYPHMTVRQNNSRSGGPPSVSIGRMQYGRNHNFGCPVIFEDVSASEFSDFFEHTPNVPSYLDSQFQDDIDKLHWTSKSAESMGFRVENNFAVGIDAALIGKEDEIKYHLLSRPGPISLWRNE